MTSSATATTGGPALAKTAEERSRWRSARLSAARLLILALLLVAPLLFGSVQPWAWSTLGLLALGALLLWAIACARARSVSLAWSTLYIPGLLFLLLGVIQLLGDFTLDAIGTREFLIKLTVDLLLFFLTGQLLATASGKTWERFGVVVGVYACSLALFAIFQFYSSQGTLYWVVKPRWGGWVFGPYVNHNHYAGLMEMLIPIGAAYALSLSRKHPTRTLLGFAVLVALASVLLSGSRGGLFALLVESLVLATVLLRHSYLTHRSNYAGPVILGLAATGLLFLWMDPGNISKRLEQLFSVVNSREASFEERINAAKDSVHVLRDHPWIGTGLGSFETIFPRYQTFVSDQHWDHAHNDYAEAIAESGLLGGALILVALIMFFRLAFRSLEARLEHRAGWVQLGATLGCCGLLAHSLGDFNLHIPANAAWFAVCAAVASHPSSSCDPFENEGYENTPGPSGAVRFQIRRARIEMRSATQ